MKALSVKQPWASMIAQGSKTIETRGWPTDYRGDILIVSTKKPDIAGLPLGKALCTAKLIDCRRMTKFDEPDAKCDWFVGAWAWLLAEIRPIEPFAVRGQLGIYDVPIE